MSHSQNITWTIHTQNTPAILRGCHRCGGRQRFSSGGLFRVNAQRSTLDVWLIHRCDACGATWNMDILSRVSPGSIPRADYDGYLGNDADLARRCAFDKELLRHNRAEAVYDDVSLEITGEAVDLAALAAPVTITLRCGHDLDLRVARLLRQKLGLSQTALRELSDQGRIVSGGDPRKIKFFDGVQVVLLPQEEPMQLHPR